MIFWVTTIIIILTYFLGSIPTGYYLTKKYTGINILDAGSGNIGSTNVKRVAGKKISIITQLLDMLKGLLPVLVVQILTANDLIQPSPYFIYLVALASIIGHDYSIFLKFKGGKGVNTTLGASLIISPIPVLTSVAIYYLAKWRFKYVSFASILLGITLPIIGMTVYGLSIKTYYLAICAAIIILRHKTNIIRLVLKTEPKISKN